jgi:antitoxin component YwqK of YwqJK toxin-antitoxin module
MPQKKKISIYRTNLVTVGLGQGEIETLPYLFSETEYDPKEEIIAQTNFSSEGLLVEKIAFDYDDQSRILTQYYYTEPDEPSEVIHYERNEKGVLVKDVKQYLDGTFDTTTYKYDEQERLVEKTTVDDEGVTDLLEQFSWKDKQLVKRQTLDPEGNIISLEEFAFDDHGNQVVHQQMNEETGENQKTVSQFDASGRKISDEISDDEGDLLEKTTYQYDETGKLLSAEYESPDKLSTTRYTYDERGNLLALGETDEDGNQLLLVEHSYDEQNNRLESMVFSGGGNYSTNQHYKLKYEYEWFDE